MDDQTCYERHHNFNRLTTWLHSFRYKAVVTIAENLAREIKDGPVRVLDIGCAHAKIFEILDQRITIEYVGIELDEQHAIIANNRYGHQPNFHVVHGSATEEETLMKYTADLVVALESLEHIPEHDVVRLIERIAQMKPAYFVCSVPVEIGPAIWLKNVGSLLSGYMRHREYTWGETFWAGLYQLDRLPPHEIGHKEFDWRWLAQTIRHNFQIDEVRRFPVTELPAALSTTLFFVARPRDGHNRTGAAPEL
jgi:hypothetical protein